MTLDLQAEARATCAEKVIQETRHQGGEAGGAPSYRLSDVAAQ